MENRIEGELLFSFSDPILLVLVTRLGQLRVTAIDS